MLELQLSGGRARRHVGLGASAAAHGTVLAILLLAPLLSQEALPTLPGYQRAPLHAPASPPPLPPIRGTLLGRATPTARPITPATQPPSAALRLSEDTPPVATAAPSPPPEQAMEVWGSPSGSGAGAEEGIEGGVHDGTAGGLPGGTRGGVIGGDGALPAPVRDYDRPPRILTQSKPVYPPDAFKPKIEGTVLVEILIGAEGRVLRARVVKSVPMLDAAALAAVRQWTFIPAFKNGRPVPAIATAPVTFRIY